MKNSNRLKMEKNQELEHFFYKASHDLKQPIRNTKMFAEILEKHLSSKECLDDDSKEYLDFILNAAQKLESLVIDLLEFSSISSDANKHTTLEMNTILEVILFNMNREKESGQLEFEIKELPVIEANQDKIKSLFNKLFSNSIKFRKPNNPLKVVVSCEELDTKWKFSVKDNGIGISGDQIEEAFVPFKKSHANSEIKGSGLGLSTCRKIVELHDGKIWLESTLGDGTTAYFTINKSVQGAANETGKLDTVSVRQTN